MEISNPSDEEIRRILREARRIAVLGMSANPEKPARRVPAFLIARGYEVIPVNPHHEQILGRKSYSTLAEVPGPIDVVEVFRPSEEIPRVVEQILKREDVRVVWLQEGIRNDEAVRPLVERGITVIQDRCMYKEYQRLLAGT